MRNKWAVLLGWLILFLSSGCAKTYYPFQTAPAISEPVNVVAEKNCDPNIVPVRKLPAVLLPVVAPTFAGNSLKALKPVRAFSPEPELRILPKAPLPALKKIPEGESRKILTSAKDPDWGPLLLMLLGLFLLMILLAVGFVALLIYIVNTFGIWAYFASLFAVVLVYITSYSILREPDTYWKENTTPKFFTFLFAQLFILGILLLVAGLAFLITLLFGTPFFWTSIIVAAAMFPIWKVVQFIDRKIKRREYEKRKRKEYEEAR